MTVRPILYSAPMIRALLDGRKSQHRMLPFAKRVRAKFPRDQRYLVDPCDLVVGDLIVPCQDIPGFEGRYAAGFDGRIYSGVHGYWRSLIASNSQKGYPVVSIVYEDGSKHTHHLHSLVCSAFYGKRPAPDIQVRHLDGNPGNGRPSNLAWGTQYENWQDRKAHGRGIEGEKHHHAKFSDEERLHIKWAISKGLASQKHAARVLGVSQGTISAICLHEHQEINQDIPPNTYPELTLEVTETRRERVQEISGEDAWAEGMPEHSKQVRQFWLFGADAKARRSMYEQAAPWDFRETWDTLHTKPGTTWEDNPEVICIGFEPIKANVDAVLRERAS